MATKKQQKRRHKRMVHGAPERTGQPAKPRPERPEKPAAKRPARSSRGGRSVPEPSWQRSIKRALLIVYLPLAVLFSLGIFGGTRSLPEGLIGAAPAALFFIPFDYYFGRMLYNRMAKRAAAAKKT